MYSHLLVPLDGSHFAESALPYALELAGKFDSKVTLVRSIDPPAIVAADVGDTAEMLLKMRELAQEEAKAYLTTKAGELRQEGYIVDVEMLIGTSPAQAILTAADDKDADLIVMCTHGRSGLGRFVFGSVAEKVVRHSNVPVLLIRAKAQTN